MKRMITLLLCLLWSSNLWATNIRPSDQVTIATRTIYNDGNLAAPDSVRIQVFRNGAEQSDAWYENADAEAAEIDGWLLFHDQLSDIDGAGGDGHYTILGRAYDLDSTLYTPWVYSFSVGPWAEDSVIVDVSAAQAGLIPVTVDSTWDETLTGATHNVATSAGRRLRQLETGQVLLTGTINTANDSTATLDLSGAYPDGFFTHTWLVVTVGPDSVQIRQINNYTGATDSVDMAAGESWVIVPANGDEWEIVAAAGSHVVDLHTPVVLQIIAAMYDKGIWVDDNAGNTNTEAGVDGTRANPVSTFTAARTLADALGYQKYYLVNNTSLTLAATHEDWQFIGIGEGNEVNFGGQDIDNSCFLGLVVAGIQGGTGIIHLDGCYLDAADSLECYATNSWFSDTISVRASTNTIFDQCYSGVAGNNTPGLDFNSAGGAVNINIRHYSGGLAIFNMTSNHTISYESDGQLVIDASCTGAKVTARGNMTITDNGTSTALTADAVYNKGYVADTVWIPDVIGSSELAASATGEIADTSRQLLLRTLLAPGWPVGGDTISSLFLDIRTIKGYTDGSDQQGVDTHVEYVEGDLDRIVPFIAPHLAYVDDATPTTSQFVVSSTMASYGDDFFNDLYLTFVTGNLLGRTKRITDFETTNDTIFTISFFAAPAQYDSFVVNSGNFDILRDSLSYQGSASGLTAAGIWQYEIRDDTTDGAVDDTSAADHLYSASVGGGGASAADVWNYEGISDFQDSTGNDQAGQYLFSVGLHNVGQNAPTVHMKLGTTYDGTEGSSVSDDFDTTFAKLDAIGSGVGFNVCSLWVYDTGNSVTVSEIMVQAENSSGANQGRDRTNVSGISVLNLNDGDYNLRIPMNSGYIQTTNPQPFTVSGATNDTINVTAFSPTAPAGDLTTLYNWIVDGNDQPIKNVEVEAYIPQKFWPVKNANKAIQAQHSIKTDSAGLWELPIFGNDIVLTDQGDSSSYWMVTATTRGDQIFKHKVTVSSDSTTQLMVPDAD